MSTREDQIFITAAFHRLDELESQFESGDGFALLAAIRVCANWGLTMPAWVAEAYITRYDQVLSCQAGSWDEVFGRPYPERSRLANMRQRRELRFDVYHRIRQILACEPTTPIDTALFEKVGAQVGIKKTLCAELYYEAKSIMEEFIPP
jgi:hypothetical protein